mgnify:CR=1 FL=1
MAASNQYLDIFRERVAAALQQAVATSSLSHQGVKGSILEILVGGLFAPLLPSDIGVGTGQIIDSYSGFLSNQIDIIIYDKSILPPILFDQKLGIFPIESVLYAIEVKTTLTSFELKNAHESAKRLATEFGYISGQTDQKGKDIHHNIEKLRSVVFALNSDLTGTGLTEAERYKKIYGNEPAHVRAICVAGREYWYDDGNFWVGTTNVSQYDEVLAFIGAVTNTYRSVSVSRGYPCLGKYIIPEVTSLVGVKSRDVASISVTCEKCGLTGQLVPEIPIQNLTVNGALVANQKCPKCDGTMKSAVGNCKFEGGKLV